MRRLILAALAAGFATFAHADMVASNGAGDELRLMQTPCTNSAILDRVKPEFHSQFKAGQASIGGKIIRLCFVDTMEGFYYVIPEGAEQGIAYPVTMFLDQPGV